MASDTPSLEDLRREIDRIDDSLHDLVMQRAALAERIAGAKGPSATFLRPGREAEIVRRLVARHHGRFPKVALVRLWREIVAALLGMQGPFSVAVFGAPGVTDYLSLARDHYGAVATTVLYGTTGQVVRAVGDGGASVGVVPLPDGEAADPWWVLLLNGSPDMPRVIARLPFATAAREPVEALVIARLQQDATGCDRTWLGLETEPDVSRARIRTLMAAVGLEVDSFAATRRGDDHWLHLVEVLGCVPPDDPRLERLVERQQTVGRAVVLGGHAVPLSAEDLAD